jgi:poly[(R)-3-hydroxyalkanoate] polymerase subunit PhaC
MVMPMVEKLFEMQRNALDEGFKAWRRALAWPNVYKHATTVQVGNTPHDVVYEEDTLRLLRYHNDRVAFREPVLICYALVNRPYILDLQPARSVVRQFLKRGFDVYLIDWGVPTAADRTMRLQDYVCGLMNNVAGVVTELSKVERFHLLGYCMGGTMSAMFTALDPGPVRTLTLMAAPIDFDRDDSLLKLWVQEQYFDVDRLVDTYGNCPGALLQNAFRVMKPVTNYYEKYLSFFENLDDGDYLENFFAMERWGTDNIPVAGETFREFVKCLYQRNQLVKGEFKLNGAPVKLANVTCPLLVLTAEHDHLVAPASTLGIVPHVRAPEVKTMSLRAGHAGLAVSSKAHKQFWPGAADWVAERSAPSA